LGFFANGERLRRAVNMTAPPAAICARMGQFIEKTVARAPQLSLNF